MRFMSPRDLHKLLESYFVFRAVHLSEDKDTPHLSHRAQLVLVTAHKFENQELDVEGREGRLAA